MKVHIVFEEEPPNDDHWPADPAPKLLGVYAHEEAAEVARDARRAGIEAECEAKTAEGLIHPDIVRRFANTVYIETHEVQE